MSNDIKTVKITFKQDEQWLSDFIHSKSSPSGYLKDLVKADYKGTKIQDTKILENPATTSNMFNFLD